MLHLKSETLETWRNVKMVKDFDCVKMKNDIQAKIYAETKDMSFEEYKTYLNSSLEKDSFWRSLQERKASRG